MVAPTETCDQVVERIRGDATVANVAVVRGASADGQGDLVFFDRLRHNGIYVGDGRFIHARQTGRRVAIASLDDEWYASHFVGARRLDPPEPARDAED